MASKSESHNHVSYGLGALWLALFIMLKVTETLADWSWWWLLMPIVPDLFWVFTKVGWL